MNSDNWSMQNLRYCSLEWLEDNIVLAKFNNGLTIDKEAALEITHAILQFTNQQPFKIVIDLQNIVWSITEEANEIFLSFPEYIKNRMKSVFLVNTLAIRLLIRFYQKNKLKDQNSKIFSSMAEGLNWIKEETN